jgi:type I restriction enzyme R subunit
LKGRCVHRRQRGRGHRRRLLRRNEAVRDGVVVDCLYEARDVNQRISDQEKIDLWFTAKTANLNDYAKADLKKKWANLQNIWSSRERLNLIVADIVLDFNTRPRLSDGRGNALLVASSIHEATVYYELFNLTELKGRVGVVTSYQPKLNDLKGEAVAEAETLSVKQFNTYRKMIAEFLGCSEEDAINQVDKYNTAVKERFVYHPARMSLLIVVDKLLTGFDAPSATYLYIDKKMRDHGLFQAMCRVNRVDPNGEDKK